MEEVKGQGFSVTIRTDQELKEQINVGSYPLRCLIYSKSGVGKSRMASTFPGLKGVIDTDNGGIVYTKAGNSLVASIPEDTIIGGDRPIAWKQILLALDHMVKKNVSALVFDSFTTIAEACMKHVLFEAGRMGQSPTFAEWGRQIQLIRELLFKAFGTGKNVIAIFHEDIERDELTGQMWCLPLITGKLSKSIPGYFDEVYHLEVREEKGKKVYEAVTKAARTFVAKSRLDSLLDGGIPERIPSDFAQLLPMITLGEVIQRMDERRPEGA